MPFTIQTSRLRASVMGCGVSASIEKFKTIDSKDAVTDEDNLNLLPKQSEETLSKSSSREKEHNSLSVVLDTSRRRSNADEVTPPQTQIPTELETCEETPEKSRKANKTDFENGSVCKKAMNYERCKFFENLDLEPRSRARFHSTLNRAGAETSRSKLTLGDCVQVRGYSGIIKYIGSTEIGEGEFIGVELNYPHAQGNNGSVGQTSYFTCEPKHGLFVRRTAVFKHTNVATISEQAELLPATIVLVQTAVRRFLTRRRLRKMRLRSHAEKAVDSHVLRTPPESAANAQQLASYLTKPWCEDRYKAFAIYRWISFNIDYDIQAKLESVDRADLIDAFDAKTVLYEGKSLSLGFSKLFQSLCTCANLESHTVGGYVRESDNQSDGQSLWHSKSIRYWNVVRVSDKWYICDVTRGTGHVRPDDFTFQRDINSYYFLVEPERAIKDHLPMDQQWQLVSEPVSQDEFERFAVPSVIFNETGIQPLSHHERELHIPDDHLDIVFYAPTRYVLTAILGNKQRGDLGLRNRVQFRPCGVDQQKLRVEIPLAGIYDLEVFVKWNGDWLSWITYRLYASCGTGEDFRGFPSLSTDFHDLGFELEQPLENIETTTGEVTVCLRCFNQRFAAITGRLIVLPQNSVQCDAGSCFIVTLKQGSLFFLEAHLQSPATYKLDVFAEYAEAEKIPEYLCSYFIDYSH